jgi:hypothetical protein
VPHSFNCKFNNEFHVKDIQNMPLLVSDDLIFQSMANLTHVQDKIHSLLSDFKILEHNFQSSILSDQPIKMSLDKLLSQAKSNNKAYINDISALHASLGYLTNDNISTSIPWLTYFNFITTIAITIFIICKFGCTGLIITAPPVHALNIENSLLSSFQIITEFDIIIIILLLVTILVLFCIFRKTSPSINTHIYLTFFSPDNECTIHLKSTALHVVPNGKLITKAAIPSFRLRVFLYIDWQDIMITCSDITLKLPKHLCLTPIQYFRVKSVLPNLKNVQISARSKTTRHGLLSWVIPFAYPPHYNSADHTAGEAPDHIPIL